MKGLNYRQLSQRVRRGVAGRISPGLRQECQWQASLIEQASDGIFVADLTGRYTYVNSAGCKLLGYGRDEIIGKTIVDLIPPEDVARLAESKRMMEQGGIHVAEWTLRRKDGAYLPVEVSAKIFPDGRWQGFVRDVSERKRLERALQKTVDDFKRAQAVANVGSWRLDVRTNELEWSDEAHRMFGVAQDRPLSYEDFLNSVHPDDRAFVDAAWSAAMRGAPYRIEHRILVDHQVKWVCENAELQFDARGVLLGGIGTVQEITARKRVEQELATAHKAEQQLRAEIERELAKVKELEQLREEWASIIAHDLRQPVGAIGIAAELLEKFHKGEVSEREAKVLERLKETGQRLSRMVDELLDASKVEVSQLSVQPRREDLVSLVHDVVELQRAALQGAEIVVDAPAELNAYFDPDRVRQVLENLISNAVKYGAPQTPVRIRVQARNDEAEVEVVNQGQGIHPDEMADLFERFWRSRRALQGSAPGLGLGLYIARGLVEAQGGRIWAESAPGETTSLHFTVPCRPAAAREAERPIAPPPADRPALPGSP